MQDGHPTTCGVDDLVLTCNAGRGRKLSGTWVNAGKGKVPRDKLMSQVLGGMKIPDPKNVDKT